VGYSTGASRFDRSSNADPAGTALLGSRPVAMPIRTAKPTQRSLNKAAVHIHQTDTSFHPLTYPELVMHSARFQTIFLEKGGTKSITKCFHILHTLTHRCKMQVSGGICQHPRLFDDVNIAD